MKRVFLIGLFPVFFGFRSAGVNAATHNLYCERMKVGLLSILNESEGS